MDHPTRVESNEALGGGRRGVDVSLGLAALAPLVALAGLAWLPIAASTLAKPAALIWAAGLLAFYAGVRRGLTFSEKRGARLGELVTMLVLFAFALAALAEHSLVIAAIGLCSVAVFDVLAARRGEVPGYFAKFRPIQMVICAAALTVLGLAALKSNAPSLR